MTDKKSFSVLGAGSWGTVLAIILAQNGHSVKLWGRDKAKLSTYAKHRVNNDYLAEAEFPETLIISDNLKETVENVENLIIAVPSIVFTDLLLQLKPFISPRARVLWGTKGMDRKSGNMLHTVAHKILGDRSLGILSGPTFAHELARQLPSAATIASKDKRFSKQMAQYFTNHYFRIYTTDDVIGVETCGMVKNILAISAGICDGMQLGANARAALITRGLAEIKRLGIHLGAKPATFMGLAGLGDLVLSCTDKQSRNYRFGLKIAENKPPNQALAEINEAVEGWFNLNSVYEFAKSSGIEMPITEQLYQVLYQEMPLEDSLKNLLAREIKEE